MPIVPLKEINNKPPVSLGQLCLIVEDGQPQCKTVRCTEKMIVGELLHLRNKYITSTEH